MGKRAQSLKDKIVKINMFFFSSVLLIIFILFFSYWYRIETNNTKKDLISIANAKTNQLYDILWNLDRTAIQLASDLYIVKDIFKKLYLNPSEGNIFEKDRVLNNSVVTTILPYVLNENITSRICLFNNYDDFVSIGDSIDAHKIKDYYKTETLINVKYEFEMGNFRVLLPPRKDPFYLKTKISTEEQVISLVREIIDYSNISSDKVGYIEVQQQIKKISRIFLDLDPSISYKLVDINNIEIIKSRITKSEKQIGVSINIDDYGYKLYLYKNNVYLIKMSLFLAGGLLLILLLLIIGIRTTENFVIRKLTKPIDELQMLINSVDIGNLDFSSSIDGEIDQIQHLEIAFRKMLLKLKDSIAEKIEAQTDELRSHLFALQAQMNPHFIHNMMAVISSIAEEYDAIEIENICNKLSSIIRYTAKYDNNEVTLNDEITHTKNYLELMHIRYENRINYSINGNYPDYVKVPKFFLQPLVENCFKHGFKSVPSPWFISIDINIFENFWSVSITDNGGGFSNEIIDSMNKLKSETTTRKTDEIIQNLQIGGMGLRNVFARLYLLYNDKMYFQIRNLNDNLGGVITVGGPI